MSHSSNKDIEKEQNIEALDYDPYDKVYMSQIAKITNLESSISIFQLFGSLSGVCVLIILAIQTSLNNTFSYFIPLCFLICTISCFGCAGNIYLKLKDVFDYIEWKAGIEIIRNKNNENENNSYDSNYSNESSFGSILSYLFLNTFCLSLICYFLLLTLKIENYLNQSVSYNIIAIPLYFSIGIGFLYFIFMLPALLQNKFYSLSAIILIFFVGSTASLIWLNQRLDLISESYFSLIFLPLLLCFTALLIYSFIDFFQINSEGENKSITKIFNFISIVLIEITIVLLGLKLDKILSLMPFYVPIVISLVVFTFFTYDYFIFNENSKEEEF